MANIFISYSSHDRHFVKKLADDLKHLGHQIWLDVWKIDVGDSIVSKIQDGLDTADFLIVVLSRKSAESSWVQREWQEKYWSEVKAAKIRVLPVLVQNCNIPTFLKSKKYADFRGERKYIAGLVQLAGSINAGSNYSGLQRPYKDFVEIDPEVWWGLFERSKSLDLLVMYSATWRHTYLKNIQQLLKQRSARLRVILPNIPQQSALLRVYAQRLKIDAQELRNCVSQAIMEFSSLAVKENVEIYTSSCYFNHSIFLFDSEEILALYSFKNDRTSTPAFHIGTGELLDFLRSDYEWLVSRDMQTKRIFPK